MGRPGDLPDGGHVLLKGEEGGVHHHRGPAVADAAHIQGKVLAVVQVEDHRDPGPFGRPRAKVPQVFKPGVVDGVLAGLDDDRSVEFLGGGDDGRKVLHVDIIDGGKGVALLRCNTKGLGPGN